MSDLVQRLRKQGANASDILTAFRRQDASEAADRIEQLEAENKRLREDAGRLDWLERKHVHVYAVSQEHGGCGVCQVSHHAADRDLRGVIDVAMRGMTRGRVRADVTSLVEIALRQSAHHSTMTFNELVAGCTYEEREQLAWHLAQMRARSTYERLRRSPEDTARAAAQPGETQE